MLFCGKENQYYTTGLKNIVNFLLVNKVRF